MIFKKTWMVSQVLTSVIHGLSVDVEMESRSGGLCRQSPDSPLYQSPHALHLLPITFTDRLTNPSITSKFSAPTELLPSTWLKPILLSKHPPCPKRLRRPNRQGNKPLYLVSSPRHLAPLRLRHQVKDALNRVLCLLLLLGPVRLVMKRHL